MTQNLIFFNLLGIQIAMQGWSLKYCWFNKNINKTAREFLAIFPTFISIILHSLFRIFLFWHRFRFIPQRFFKDLSKIQLYYHCNTRVFLFYEIRVEQTGWKSISLWTISNPTPILYCTNVLHGTFLYFQYLELPFFQISKKRSLLLTGDLIVKK